MEDMLILNGCNWHSIFANSCPRRINKFTDVVTASQSPLFDGKLAQNESIKRYTVRSVDSRERQTVIYYAIDEAIWLDFHSNDGFHLSFSRLANRLIHPSQKSVLGWDWLRTGKGGFRIENHVIPERKWSYVISEFIPSFQTVNPSFH